MSPAPRIGAVLIGRNEGDRLGQALAAATGFDQVVYVDSGSTDDSVARAEAAGADVVHLDMDQPFTAARARNAGLARLRDLIAPDVVQFIDGDCALAEGWVQTAATFLSTSPKIAAVCGRRRERHPDASVYNRLCDREWDTPIGLAKACGGDAMMRVDALAQVDGFSDDMIAGEEPELCVRLRAAGWQIWRLDHEMTLHDADMTRFGQWWRRARRAGHAYAEGAWRHGAPPERHNVPQTRRALLWGLVLPLAILAAGALLTPWAWLAALIYPVQILRLGSRSGDWAEAFFLTLGKFAETRGILEFHLNRLRNRKAHLIEYK